MLLPVFVMVVASDSKHNRLVLTEALVEGDRMRVGYENTVRDGNDTTGAFDIVLYTL